MSVFHVSSLSNSAILNFQWVPGHAGTGTKHANSFSKTEASMPTATVAYPSPQLSPKPVKPISQMEASHFHISPLFSTVSFL